MFVSCLTALEQDKHRLTSQYSSAESTRIFWEKCPKTVSVSKFCCQYQSIMFSWIFSWLGGTVVL